MRSKVDDNINVEFKGIGMDRAKGGTHRIIETNWSG